MRGSFIKLIKVNMFPALIANKVDIYDLSVDEVVWLKNNVYFYMK